MKRSVFLLLDHYPQTGETLAEVHAFALEHGRSADSLGYEALWLAEHHFQRLGTLPNPAIMLAAMATQTRRLRIGPAVSVLPYRNPVLVAEDYALVDMLSDGRLNMGVGCGSQRTEFDGLGVDFDHRWEVFQSHLSELRQRWSATTLNVAPRQQPAPPIYVATSNEGNARTVGCEGDSVITLISPMAEDLGDLVGLVEAHRRGLCEGGHAQQSAEVVVALLAHVAPTDREARRQAVPAISQLLSMLGVDASRAETVYEKLQSVGAGCFGSPARAKSCISRLEKAGVEHVALMTRFGSMNMAAAQRSLRLLAPQSAMADQSVDRHRGDAERTRNDYRE